MPRKIPSLIPGALGALIVLATIFAVGRPAVFTDTRDYFIHGARFYQALRRVAFNEADAPAQPAPGQKWTRQQWVKHFNHSNMGARSPYYGVFLYTLAHHGTLWAMTAVQALCCAWLAFLLWRGMAPNAPGWTYYALMAALCAGTSLPWVAGFAVPDIFAPVTAMAIVLIALYRQGLERWEKAGVWVLLTAGILFHGSHLLLTLSLLPFVLGAAWLLKPDAGALRRTGGLILGAAAAASVLGFVYAAAIRVHTGDELRRPPFLIARVLADGPGRAYLRHSCAEGAPWVICKYKDLPLARSDDILWSAKKTLGVFNRSSYEERLAMEDQENSFVLHTIAYDPWGQLYASARNWWRQLLRCWVDDPLRRPSVFLRHNYWGRTNLVGLIRGVGDCGRSGALCEPKVTISGLAAVDEKVLLLALAGMVVALAQRKALGRLLRRDAGWDDPAGRATLAAVLLCAAVVLNAAVCGVVSGPFPRYQARIVWLLPEAAMLLGLALAPARAWAWARLPSAWRSRPPGSTRPAPYGARSTRPSCGSAWWGRWASAPTRRCCTCS
ncbi:MAG: hypothetical protein WDM92_04500 [Caulobacteraceae bacterium]